MTCACSRISSSGSMVSCMTPTLKGGAGVTRLLAAEGARELRAVQERAAERAARAVALDDRPDVRRVQVLLALVLDLKRRRFERPVARRRDDQDERDAGRLGRGEGRGLPEADHEVADDLQAHAVRPLRGLPARLERQLGRAAVGDQRGAVDALRAGLLVRDALADDGRRRGRGSQRERGCDEDGEDEQDALHAVTLACWTWSSSALSTFETCWLTIGWNTRWPIDPIGPATWMSATQFIF